MKARGYYFNEVCARYRVKVALKKKKTWTKKCFKLKKKNFWGSYSGPLYCQSSILPNKLRLLATLLPYHFSKYDPICNLYVHSICNPYEETSAEPYPNPNTNVRFAC